MSYIFFLCCFCKSGLDSLVKIVYYVNCSFCELNMMQEGGTSDGSYQEVLRVWLQLSLAINNERVVSGLPYNEFLICGILYLESEARRAPGADGHGSVRRDEDSEIPRMNRTLNSLEKKGLIDADPLGPG